MKIINVINSRHGQLLLLSSSGLRVVVVVGGLGTGSLSPSQSGHHGVQALIID